MRDGKVDINCTKLLHLDVDVQTVGQIESSIRTLDCADTSA